MATFKIFFSNDNIRRIRVQRIPSFKDFGRMLDARYNNYAPHMKIKYYDSDNLQQTINNELEWMQMLCDQNGDNVFRLYICDDQKVPFLKDYSGPVPLYFYMDQVTKDPVDDGYCESFKESVPRCLEALFHDGKIIPGELPSFLEAAIKVTTKQLSNVEVIIDVHISKLFNSLHRETIQIIKNRELILAKKYLLAMLELKPNHYIVLYNLACVESLLDNHESAISALEKSIENGYEDIKHILDDPDLNNIKSLDPFNKLIDLISSKYIYELENSDKSKWSTQLEALHDMGFKNDDLSILFLEQFNGEVNNVVSSLISLDNNYITNGI
eukprot:TRINITY_DN6834_c0_g2_i1.p1 TRINITY_DN6834_c0_g2~~TRINITY_DN6834_c0_g2_i1.p1  ORF type:complete len:327 (+),score=56.51 TRINITY_DN6834_c0_g2_i1:159-1139(+)